MAYCHTSTVAAEVDHLLLPTQGKERRGTVNYVLHIPYRSCLGMASGSGSSPLYVSEPSGVNVSSDGIVLLK